MRMERGTGHGEQVQPGVVAHLVSSCLYAGFQLTIRALVYPQMTMVPATAWVAFERAHRRRVTQVVGPLFAVQIVATGLLTRTADSSPPERFGAVVLLVLLLTVTALGAAPAHARLSETRSATVYLVLLRWDSARVVIAVAQVALSLIIVTG